jgi:hypothetical protein
MLHNVVQARDEVIVMSLEQYRKHHSSGRILLQDKGNCAVIMTPSTYKKM